jgi:hypothetical protein
VYNNSETILAYIQNFTEILMGKSDMEEQSMDGRIILKRILKTWVLKL